jgi:ketosteroid isomerase-like protein
MRNVVATPVKHRGPKRSRNLEERLIVRFPSLYRRQSALSLRLLSPRSRLRRALVRRAVVSGWDATSRQDFELMLVRYAPTVELEPDPDFEALGIGGKSRGHEGVLKMIRAFQEEWRQWELLPAMVYDLGDRVLSLGTFRLSGTASGLELERQLAQLVTLRGGLVVRDQYWLAWDEGLGAAGLEPDAIALPLRGKAAQSASSAG